MKNKLELFSINLSNNSCQYVMVLFFPHQYVDTFACYQNSIKKQMEVLSI